MSKRNPKYQRKLAKALKTPISSAPVKGEANEQAFRDNQKALLKLAVESWRFSRTVARSIALMDSSEAAKIDRQFRWFSKQVEESLKDAGLRLVNLEGLEYDPGHAATALNLDDFEVEDVLVVVQMIDPVIMDDNGLVSPGTVMLGKAQ